MANFRLRHFADRATLQSIAPHRLVEFLASYQEFFILRGYKLPALPGGTEIDIDRLTEIFMTPDARTPQQLISTDAVRQLAIGPKVSGFALTA